MVGVVAGYPERIVNWIGGAETPAASGQTFDKTAPA